MKRMIDMGSIEQFRTIVKNAQHNSRYIGTSEDGSPIFDSTIKSPVVKAVGTEKIHGTNAAVSYSIPDGFWVQSRSNIITPEKDNAGCAFIAEIHSNSWIMIVQMLAAHHKINLNENIITIFYEFCGGNIQKNAAVSGLDKMSIIFKHFKVSPIEPSETEYSRWYETCYEVEDGKMKWIESPIINVFNIHNFPTYEISVDFKRPDIAQNEMIRLTEDIEENSGVAKHFNKPENIGEGIVWTFVDSKGNLARWKTKGDKHSNSKVKTLQSVDSEKEQTKIDFANYACPAWRLEQMLKTVQDEIEEKIDMKHTGDFLRKVINDIIKEESDIMIEKKLEPKEVNSYISKIARSWFMEQLNSEVGL